MNCLVFEASSEIPWLGTWIKAQAQLHSKEFSNAIQTYRSLDIYGVLKDNTTLLVNLAYCHHYLYEDQKAISLLQKVFLYKHYKSVFIHVFIIGNSFRTKHKFWP